MKKTTKKFLIISLIPIFYQSADANLINIDGRFDIPKIQPHANEWLNNPDITQTRFDSNKLSGDFVNEFIAKDNEGKYIKEDHVVVLKNDPISDEYKKYTIYGGYCNANTDKCNVNNTAIILDGVFGEYIPRSPYSTIDGAYVYSDFPTIEGEIIAKGTGSIFATNSTLNSTLSGAFVVASGLDTNISSTATGSVILTNSKHANISGAVGISSIVDEYNEGTIYGYATTTGSVFLTNSTVSQVTGAYSQAYANKPTNLGDIHTFATANGSVFLTNSASDFYNIYGAYVDSIVYSRHDAAPINDHAFSSAIGRVFLTNSTAANDIIGAYARNESENYITSTSMGNVFLTNSTVSGDIIGADAEFFTYSGNTYYYPSITATGSIYIYGDSKLQDHNRAYNSSLYATRLTERYLDDSVPLYYNIFSGNVLSFGNSPLTIKNLSNFETYNFYINDYNKAYINTNTALLTVTDSIKNDNTITEQGITTNKSTIKLAGIASVGIVNIGSSINLIDATGVSTFEGGDNTGNINSLFATKTGDVVNNIDVGLVGKADAHYVIANNTISVIVDDIRIDKERVNLNIKPLAEARIATLQNTTRAADILVNRVMGENKPIGTFTPIALIDGGLTTYDSGASVYARDYRIIVGSRYQFLDNLYSGLTFEYGRSNYDTDNHFDGDRVKGDGHTYNYGFSLFGKYSYDFEVSSLYIDTAFRFGRTSTEFQSGDIGIGSGDYAHYKSKVNYISGIVGMGYIYPLNEISNLDLSLHYFYTRLNSDSIVLDGDKVNFKKATSSKVQLKEKYSYQSSQDIKLTLGAIYEYEFNSKSKANVSGVSANAPSVKGSTGILEIGMVSTPLDDKDFSLNLNVRGYGGKRDGVSIGVLVEYNF